MTLKNIFLLSLILFTTKIVFAQEKIQTIQLNTPNRTRGDAVMKALSNRHSSREFSTTELSLQDLSDLLWAANGINRKDGRRTAPSAMNKQDIDIYVIRPEGAYRYDPGKNVLQLITSGDHRDAVAHGQDFVRTAPVCLVLVSNTNKFGDFNNALVQRIAALDAGIVSQNINIFCSATGLATVPRVYMDETRLQKILKLTPEQKLMINNPVGYPKK